MQSGISFRGRSRDQSSIPAIGSIHQAKPNPAPFGAVGENISNSHVSVILSAIVGHFIFHPKMQRAP
jgi:hypothetical protein